jgi:hypothetical protein
MAGPRRADASGMLWRGRLLPGACPGGGRGCCTISQKKSASAATSVLIGMAGASTGQFRWQGLVQPTVAWSRPALLQKKMRPPPAPHGWRAERTIGTAQEQRSRGGIIPPGVTPRSDRCIVSHSDKLTKMGAPPTRRKLAHARSGAGPTARAQPRAEDPFSRTLAPPARPAPAVPSRPTPRAREAPFPPSSWPSWSSAFSAVNPCLLSRGRWAGPRALHPMPLAAPPTLASPSFPAWRPLRPAGEWRPMGPSPALARRGGSSSPVGRAKHFDRGVGIPIEAPALTVLGADASVSKIAQGP